MHPRAEDPLPEESATPEVEVDIPSSSLEVLALVDTQSSLSVAVSDSSVEPTQLSLLLSITQGSCRLRQYYSSLCI